MRVSLAFATQTRGGGIWVGVVVAVVGGRDDVLPKEIESTDERVQGR